VPKPYDRQPGETQAAYTHFLYYRNLGPTRTIANAYRKYMEDGGHKPKGKNRQTSGHWHREANRHNWHDRALSWDIDNLQSQGEQVIIFQMELLKAIQQRVLESLENGIAPDKFEDLIKTLELLSKIIPGEAAASLYLSRQPEGEGEDGDGEE
jgi:hypothetical protein